MRIPGLGLALRTPAGAAADLASRSVDADAWQRRRARDRRRPADGSSRCGAPIAARRDGGFAVCAAYALADGLRLARARARRRMRPAYPDLSPHLPVRDRMQRAVADLLGIVADRRATTRGHGCDHGAWPADHFPLRRRAVRRRDRLDARRRSTIRSFASTATASTRSPVGPVHAGIIEPGHFRFSVVGEKVLRLEERLGYTHKGIEKRFDATSPPLDGHRLAGRVSGDSTVAYAWAYCMALESAGRRTSPARARSGCARCCSSASASPTIWATSARSATTPRSRSAWRSSRACKRRLAAR